MEAFYLNLKMLSKNLFNSLNGKVQWTKEDKFLKQKITKLISIVDMYAVRISVRRTNGGELSQ